MTLSEAEHRFEGTDAPALPKALQPAGFEEMVLPSGRVVRVPKVRAEFRAWSGPISIHTWGSKPVLDVAGEQTFAEVAILRLFQSAGWEARWLEVYGASSAWPIVLERWHPEGIGACERSTIPDERVSDTIRSIVERNGTSSGCWDVVAWNGAHVVFAESKRRGKDRMRETQRRWLESALEVGVPLSSFLVVEWTFASGAQPTDHKAPSTKVKRTLGSLGNSTQGSSRDAPSRPSARAPESSVGPTPPSRSATDVNLFTSRADWVRWYEAHPDGFFYNEKSGGKLHRVGCPHYKLDGGIEEYFKSPKPCHEELDALGLWTERRFGVRAGLCKSCFPQRDGATRR